MRSIIILSLISFALSNHSVAQTRSDCGARPSAYDEYLSLSEEERQKVGSNLAYVQSQEYSDRSVAHTRCLADNGEPDAQLSMGVLYRDGGNWVPQNYSRATEWFLKAARNGNGMAMYNLGRIYLLGLGIEPDLVEAHMWFNLAAVTLELNGTRNSAFSYREEISEKMNPEEVSRAQEKATKMINEINAR